jgi:hypothetical protein
MTEHEHLLIKRHTFYHLNFEGTDPMKHTLIKGDDLLDSITGTLHKQYAKDIIKPELKSLHIALSRAIEEGDQLKIGIVLGQTLTKLESLINGS